MNLTDITDDISPNDLTDVLSAYWGIKSDAELARELGIEDRRKVTQYRNRKGKDDIQYRMIVALLRDIGYLERKITSLSEVGTGHALSTAPTAVTA
ncbi:MAG: hypothetical protein BWK73_04535 [Thiothrix lacustris]|uniref:Uncharacterized protein n=1 Tax=Thiothrix lacustris TaxID=525917 RepID=A0A1Y1QXR3_9GAMM|nr:MAG: hypothetical protein BWK73_04535 [Thiothrix lacustris]